MLEAGGAVQVATAKSLTVVPSPGVGKLITLLSSLLTLTILGEAFATQASMRLTIPRAAHPPVLDGKLAAGEWDDAAAVTGLINQFDGFAHPRQATFWMSYDNKYVYVAQRSTLLAGERKSPPAMPPLYFKDDQNTVTIALAPNRINSGDTPSHYRFMANVTSSVPTRRELCDQIKGVKFNAISTAYDSLDARQMPNGAKAFNSLGADETVWESEYAIPLAEMNVEKTPDGEEWGLLLARDYPQLDQNAIVRTTSYRFDYVVRDWRNLALAAAYHVRSDYARATLSNTSPVVQVRELGDVLGGRVKPVLSFYNPAAADASVKISLGVGAAAPPQEQTIVLAAGERKQWTCDEIKMPEGVVSALSLSVSDASGGVLFQQQVPIRPGYGREQTVLVPDLWFAGEPKLCASVVVPISVYNPVQNTLWVLARPSGRPGEAVPTRAEVAVRFAAEEKPFVTYPMSPSVSRPGSFELKTNLPALMPGLYEVTATTYGKDDKPADVGASVMNASNVAPTATDKSGKVLARARDQFIRYDHEKDLPWISNKIGVSDRVLEPWTPIQSNETEGGTVDLSCWGRTYTVDGSGLPTQIQSLDENILSAPVRIEMTRGGQPVALAPAAKVLAGATARHEANFAGALTGDGWNIATAARLEYDGYLLYRIRLEPQGPQSVDRIKFVIPLTPQQSRDLHAASGGLMRGMVSTQPLKPDKGPLWDSSQQAGGPDYNGLGLTVGNFKAYVWIGGVKRGLAFMADNDKGWVPDDTKKVSAIEVVRDEAGVNLILNLVARPFTFDHAREITFSLQATPIKPLPEDFRYKRLQLNMGSAFVGMDKDSWGWDGCQLWLNNTLFLGGQGSAPFPINWEKNIAWTKNEGFREWHKPGSDPVVTKYQAMNAFFHHPEIDDARTPGLQGANWYGYLQPEITAHRDIYDASISQTELEYRIWRYRRWIKETSLHGFYFDNAFSADSANPDARLGYVIDLPDRPNLHGRIQTGYAWTGIREMLKRLRTVIIAEGRTPYLWMHATDTYMISAYAFADYLLDGENLPMLTPENPWFSEKWSPQYMQVINDSAKWGVGTTMLDMRSGEFGPHHLNPLARANFRDYCGYLQLHDIEASSWRYTDWSGLDLKRKADFLPYWDPAVAAALQTGNDKVFASAYRQDNRLMLIVFNRQADAQQNLKMVIDPAALGIAVLQGRTFVVKDIQGNAKHDPAALNWSPETDAALQLDGPRLNLTYSIGAHDYRLLRIESSGD